jgi:hypothetical protein
MSCGTYTSVCAPQKSLPNDHANACCRLIGSVAPPIHSAPPNSLSPYHAQLSGLHSPLALPNGHRVPSAARGAMGSATVWSGPTGASTSTAATSSALPTYLRIVGRGTATTAGLPKPLIPVTRSTWVKKGSYRHRNDGTRRRPPKAPAQSRSILARYDGTTRSTAAR